MKKLDMYLDLCTQAYDLNRPSAPSDAYAFYRQYVINAAGPILEPMCGSGNYLLPLCEEGFKIEGFDASESMLKSLHARAASKKLTPQVWYGFLEDLGDAQKHGGNGAGTYDLIFIPEASFCLIIDFETVQMCLQKIYDRLSADGLFVFEAITANWKPSQFGVWHGSVLEKEDGTCIISSYLDLSAKDSVFKSLSKYELISGNQILKTEIEQFNLRLYDQIYLTRMLVAAGFKDIKVLKAFDATKIPEATDVIIVYECRK